MTTATGPVGAALPALPAVLAVTALAVAWLLAAARRGRTRPGPQSTAPEHPAPHDLGQAHLGPEHPASPEAAPEHPALEQSALEQSGHAHPAPARPAPAPSDSPDPDASGHPESLTAVLEPEAEEYLAWLADHHWPADEYLELEEHWRHELDPFDTPDPADIPLCPRCRLRREDVWPCPRCGRLLHSSCGHGMRRRRVDRPYPTRATDSEAVVAEWLCTGCASVVGLDVGHDDEPGGGLLR
ncbi:hypothetical protein ACQEU3_03385 [Spirillospora sp. CA-253888]